MQGAGMRVGVSTASLFDRKNNEDALPCLNELGIKTAEVFLTSFSEYGESFGKLLASRKGELSVHSIHDLNSQFEPQLFSTHERVKQDAFYWLKKVMEAGRELGASCYTFHGTARYKKASRSGKLDNFPLMGKAFSEIYETCADYGLKLCLENVEWATYNRLGVFQEMKKYAPNLGGVLDIKQARISGYDYRDYLSEMGESITHVHLSDIDEKGKICLPGRGIFPFKELLKRLKDVGFDGPLLIEVYKDDYQTVQELKESADYLNELLYSLK